MTVQKIIQEAINKSPRDLKEALESELRSRISEAIAEKMEEVEELDEAFEEGDKVHFQDEYGQKLHGHITKPFSAKKNGAKHAEVRLVGGMGTKMHVPHGQLKKVYEEVELDEGISSMYHKIKAKSASRKADDAFDTGDEKDFVKHMDKSTYHKLKAGEKVHGVRDKDKFMSNYKKTYGEETELDEAKIGDRVKIHKPGKDYHGHIGTVGEVRKRTYGTGAPSYTVDYYKPGSDHRHSVTLNRDEFKKHKEQRGLLDAKESFDLSDFSIEELEDFMESAEFDQLDEISGKTLGSYIQKARAQDSAKRAHNKELDDHPKVKALRDKMTDLYNRREYTKSGENRNRKSIDKTRADIEAQKKKLDPNYPKSAYAKRQKGIETAIKKLSYGKMTDSYDAYDTSSEE